MDTQEFISNVGRLPSQMAFLKEPLSREEIKNPRRGIPDFFTTGELIPVSHRFRFALRSFVAFP
jgi:hypothetical protein